MSVLSLVSEGLVLLLRVPNTIDLRAEPAVRSRFEGNSSILGSTLWGLKSTLGAYPQGSGERSEYFEGYP